MSIIYFSIQWDDRVSLFRFDPIFYLSQERKSSIKTSQLSDAKDARRKKRNRYNPLK